MEKIPENEMVEIDFLRLLRSSLKHIKAIIVIMVCFIAAGAVIIKTQTTTYVSTATMAVMFDGSTTNESSNGKYTFSENLSKTFALFISENVVLDRVSEKTGYSVNALKRGLSVSNNNLIINLTYTDIDPKAAAIVLNTVMNTAIEVANTTDELGQPQYKLLYDNLTIFSNATKAKSVRHTTQYAFFSVLAGIIVSFIYVVICYVNDKKFTSVKEIEELLDVPVFTSVPFYMFDGGKDRNE